MVEYALNLDTIFGSLADPTRRDILRRVSLRSLSVNDIAAHYDTSLAAISKHLKILEKARLIVKHHRGRERIVSISPAAFRVADDYLKAYEQLWIERLDRLEIILTEEQNNE